MISLKSLHMAWWLPLLLFCLNTWPTSTHAQSSPALQMRWSEMTQNNQGPGALKDFGMSFDFQRNQIIVFGGIKSGAGQVSDTWAFNLTSKTWRAIAASQTTKPQPRHYFAYGIDKAGGRDRFVISSGQGSDLYSDVWALDLVTETWTQLAPNGAPGAPTNRYGVTGGTWDFDSRYLFVTHGFGKRKRYGDTFAFDLATNTWTEVSPDARRPSSRCLLAGTTLDQNRVVLMGGCGSGGWGPCPGQDAWVFSTATTPQASQSHWTRMSTCPGPRVYPAMAASPGNPNGTTVKQVVLYGGVTRGVYKNDEPGQISLLDVTSSKWVSAMPAGPVPPGTRDGPRMVYIYSAFGEVRDTDYVIMYGGAGHDDMWKLTVDTTVPLQTRECPYVFDLRLFHALTMFFAWCVFLPIGVFAARFGRLWPNMWWFKIHPWANGLGVLLTIGGLVSGVLMVALPMISAHAILGFIVCAICFFQPLNAVIRPHIKPGVPKTKLRVVWEYIHKYSGRIGIILGSQQPFLGLIYILAEPEVHILFYIYFALCWSFVIALTVMGFPATSPLAGWCKRTFFPNWMPGPWAKYFGGVNDAKAMPDEPPSTSPTPPPATSDGVAMGNL